MYLKYQRKLKSKIKQSPITENNFKVKNKARFKMPDKRKGIYQKAQIGDHKVYLHTENMMTEKLVKFSLTLIKRVS